jgi:CheY-like chemotaxis protein
MADLSAAVAHDFNNLLAAISINAELVRDGRGTPEQASAIILKAAERGRDITRRLFAFSGQWGLSLVPLSLAEMLSSSRGSIAEALGADIELCLRLPPAHWHVLADPKALSQVVLELARNARDAMTEGGRFTVEVTASPAVDQEGARDDDPSVGDYLVLCVGDTGSGMSPEVLQRACEPLFTTKAASLNPGLGLSLVYGYVEQTGGHVVIDSVVGEGTTVRLLLPRAGDPGKEPDDSEESEHRQPAESAGHSVLVVEDDDDLRALITQFLSASDFEAVAASDGESALAAMEARGAPFDLVLSDVILVGGMSGPAFVEAAEARGWLTKVLYMSGYPQYIERGQANLLEDAEIIAKPFRRAELVARIREMLETDNGAD